MSQTAVERNIEEKIEKTRIAILEGTPVYKACEENNLSLEAWYRRNDECANCSRLKQELKTVKKKKADLIAYIKQLF